MAAALASTDLAFVNRLASLESPTIDNCCEATFDRSAGIAASQVTARQYNRNNIDIEVELESRAMAKVRPSQ